MTCQIRVLGANGHATLARALLDTASSTSFVTERIVQQLSLHRQRRRIQVTGVGGVTEGPVARSFVNFDVLGAHPYEGKTRETI